MIGFNPARPAFERVTAKHHQWAEKHPGALVPWVYETDWKCQCIECLLYRALVRSARRSSGPVNTTPRKTAEAPVDTRTCLVWLDGAGE